MGMDWMARLRDDVILADGGGRWRGGAAGPGRNGNVTTAGPPPPTGLGGMDVYQLKRGAEEMARLGILARRDLGCALHPTPYVSSYEPYLKAPSPEL